MKRRLFARALFLLATVLPGAAGLLLPAADAQGPTHVWIVPTGQKADYRDGHFDIRVELENLDHHGSIQYDIDRDGIVDREEPSNGLGAYEMTLIYNPSVVRVAGMDAGDFLRSEGRSTTCFQRQSAPNEFSIGCVSFGGSEGPQGSGNLAVITLEPVSNGVTFLVLEAELAGPLGDPIDSDASGGITEVFNGPSAPPPVVTVGPGTPQPPGPGANSTALPPSGGTPNIPAGFTPVDINGDGTPDELVNAPGTVIPFDPESSAATGESDDGSSATVWIIGAVAAAITLVVLLFAARLVIRARGV